MKNTIFKGMATAMVTPMTPHGVDYDAFARFIDFQLENGINALVAVGTTGESATLSPQERREVIRFTVERVNGRVPVIAGTGTNNTEHVIEFTRSACGDGADGLLIVTPYYNKATQNGLVAHYTAVADQAEKPIIMYNVPGRTGCNILPQTAVTLGRTVENIVGIKEACGNISQIAELMALADGCLDVYSGNDDQIVPIMALGGKGVISVLSNVAPTQTHEMAKACLDGDYKKAAKMQLDAIDLCGALFCEVNPIPVKTAMNLQGWEVGPLRAPLSEMEPQNLARLQKAMEAYGVL